MIKLLLQTTTLSVLFLSPAFCMDGSSTDSLLEEGGSSASESPILSRKRKQHSSESLEKKWNQKANYHEAKACVCRANAALSVAGDLKEKKEKLKEAEDFYEKAIGLGYPKAQFQLAKVLSRLSEIDPAYKTPEMEERIKTLTKNARKAGSERGATEQFIFGPGLRTLSEEDVRGKETGTKRKKSLSTSQ